MKDVNKLPDGLYWDGTYRWIKDDTYWAPLNAPHGMPSEPNPEDLSKVVEVHEPIDWDEVEVYALLYEALGTIMTRGEIRKLSDKIWEIL